MKVKYYLGIALVAMLASCGSKPTAKEVGLKDQSDSLNYALGMANGAGIRQYYLMNDTTGEALTALINAIDKAYKAGEEEADQIYQLGRNIGLSFQQMNESGLFNDQDIQFDEKLAMQGLINGLNHYSGGIEATEATSYIDNTLRQLHEAKMKAAQPVMPATDEDDAE